MTRQTEMWFKDLPPTTRLCPRCQQRYKSEEKKQTVSYMRKELSSATNYYLLVCPKCGYKEYNKIQKHI